MFGVRSTSPTRMMMVALIAMGDRGASGSVGAHHGGERRVPGRPWIGGRQISACAPTVVR